MFRKVCLALCGVLLALPLVTHAQQKVIHLTSLDWPPYSGAQLPEQGASVAVAKAAAKAMGYELKVDFLPWARAVAAAESGAGGVVGYFPEYHSADVASRFVLSNPIGSGPLGFVEQRAAPVTWNALTDLAGKPIGTVRDYVNTDAFDRMAAEGKLSVEVVNDDATNLKKVAAGRIPLAVIDRYVMNYLLSHDASLKSLADKLQFNAKLLEDKQLYIAFQKSPAGEEAAKVINDGLKKIDVAAIVAPYFAN